MSSRLHAIAVVQTFRINQYIVMINTKESIDEHRFRNKKSEDLLDAPSQRPESVFRMDRFSRFRGLEVIAYMKLWKRTTKNCTRVRAL